jgi:hypothetical protein
LCCRAGDPARTHRCKLGRCPLCFPTILRYAKEKRKSEEEQHALYDKFLTMDFVCEACAATGRTKGVPDGMPPLVEAGESVEQGHWVHTRPDALWVCQHVSPPHGCSSTDANGTDTHRRRTRAGPLPGFRHLQLLPDGSIAPAGTAAAGSKQQQQSKKQRGAAGGSGSGQKPSVAAAKRAGFFDDSDSESDTDAAAGVGGCW